MRIACVYHPRLYTGCGKFHFIADALRALGHEVEHVQTLEELQAADARSDIVLFEQRCPGSIGDVQLEEFAPQRKAWWTQWNFDLGAFDDGPIAKQPGIEPFLRVMRSMDLVLVKERGLLDEYKAAGINAIWFDQACPSNMRQAKLESDPPYDVLVWGSARPPLWKQRRMDAFSLTEAGFRVAWASDSGDVPPGCARLPGCQPLELPDLIEQAKVSLVVDARQDVEGYYSDRIWLAAGAGACIVRRVCEGSGPLPGLGYHGDRTLLHECRMLCDNFEARVKSGQLSRDMVFGPRGTFGRHTYEARCEELLREITTIREARDVAVSA